MSRRGVGLPTNNLFQKSFLHRCCIKAFCTPQRQNAGLVSQGDLVRARSQNSSSFRSSSALVSFRIVSFATKRMPYPHLFQEYPGKVAESAGHRRVARPVSEDKRVDSFLVLVHHFLLLVLRGGGGGVHMTTSFVHNVRDQGVRELFGGSVLRLSGEVQGRRGRCSAE